MDEGKLSFDIKCSFCGEMNVFSKEELYYSQDGKEQFREKFCLDCGEPLILNCPNCQRNFPLDVNFTKNNFFKVHKTYWDPTPSPLDQLLPKLQNQNNQYKEKAKNLGSNNFRLNRKEFLAMIPEIRAKLDGLKETLEEIMTIPLVSSLDKSFKKFLKEIYNVLEECKNIQKDIKIGKENGVEYWVNEKREKQLNKRVPFLNFQDSIISFVNSVQILRDNEIKSEQDSLKPGYHKIKDYIQQDSEFYRIICPICNSKVYSVGHHIYKENPNDMKLQLIDSISRFDKKEEKSTDTMMIRFKVNMNIEKGSNYSFHGQLALLLHENEPTVIGRDLLREIEYDETSSETILFDEDDPLARISNRQLTLIKRGNKIIIKGMEYDERRIGTFLNTGEHDIRIQNQNGIEIQQGSKIIIPLVNEPENKNQITLFLE